MKDLRNMISWNTDFKKKKKKAVKVELKMPEPDYFSFTAGEYAT